MINSFGIEIEFDDNNNSFYSKQKLKEIFDKILCQYRQPLLCDRENKKDWTIKRDSSCGWEITTPVFEQNRNNIELISKIIYSFNKLLLKQKHFDNIYTSKTGLHIHLNKLNNKEKHWNLIKCFYYLEVDLFELQPIGRMNNYYSRKITKYHLCYYQQCFNRYDKIHEAINFSRHNTLEFRHASSTGYYRDIKYWLVLLIFLNGIVDNTENNFDSINSQISIKSFINQYRLSSDYLWIKVYKRQLFKWIDEKGIYRECGGKMRTLKYFK